MERKFFGDYVLVKQIGQGALGSVFLAEHRFMKRQFTIKMLPQELSQDRSFLQRLEEEICALAALDHPRIVKMHNISFAEGRYFLVTDCIVDDIGETTNLAQYLLAKGRTLDEKLVMHILEQVADALDYAHGKKIGSKAVAHRGIKLNNVLIGKQKDGLPEIFLTDFGLSRIIGTSAVLTKTYLAVAESLGVRSTHLAAKSPGESYANISADGNKLSSLHASFLQTFAFVAPEQKKIDMLGLIDGKVDSYAFGVLAYRLLTGEFPEGFFEMPSAFLPACCWNWDELVAKCLQNDPAKRPALLKQALEDIKKRKPASTPAFDPPKENRQVSAVFQPLQTAALKDLSEPLQPVLQKTLLERPQHDPDPAAALQVDGTVKHYIPEAKDVNNIQPLLTDMIIVRGGAFQRGSNEGSRDEVPRHQITLSAFAMDIHPVTNEQFVRFLEVMGGEKDSNHQDIIRLRDSRIKRSAGKLNIESGYSKHPVVGVTWYGAMAYAKWVGKRLPTEAEWEIASYGRQEFSLYPTGENIEKTEANFFSSDTTPVMSYAPNGYGLYDMAGNVYEWCHDWYGYNYYETSVQEPENPTGPLQGVYRVLRGGCWKSLKEDLRCSHRHRNNPGTVNGTYGFRCAADVV